MRSYTIPQLSSILSGLVYLTQDRFVKNFRTLYGHTEEQAQGYWKLSQQIVWNLREEQHIEAIEDLLEKLPAVIERVRNTTENPYRYNRHGERKTEIAKIVYKENDSIQELVVDFCETIDTLCYADLLRRKIEIIALLKYVEDVCKGEKNIQAFEGDFFTTTDSYYRGYRGEVYLLHEGCYRKLLYTESRGYMHNGEPVMAEGKYNFHVLTMNEHFVRRGNIYVDYSFLIDKPQTEK